MPPSRDTSRVVAYVVWPISVWPCIFKAYIATAYIEMACIVTAYIEMAYIVMAYTGRDHMPPAGKPVVLVQMGVGTKE